MNDINAFVKWFRLSGGVVDTQAMGITEFSGSGRGAIALRDLPEGYTLFTLPRTITLSTRTSPLPALFGFDAWRAHGMHKGWVGLILCMMWEDARTHESDVIDGAGRGEGDIRIEWGPYMRTLPTIFNTPMFWGAEELKELKGTSVVDKIGREDAERAYFEQLVPAINTSPTLFPPSHHEKWYSLDAYHRAGSRILSRSFTVSCFADGEEVENQDRVVEADGDDADEVDNINEFPMHVDDVYLPPHSDDELGSDLEDDKEDDPSDVAMVPMADLLNARWGSENAKLFYEPSILRMVTTTNIREGEQIFNTYGDPPNSDLLRRYGHVDLVRLCSSTSAPAPNGLTDVEMQDGDTDVECILHLGNPSDVVEVRADLVVRVIQTTNFKSKVDGVHGRIEWWLDEGEDDIFVLSLPDAGSHPSAILPSTLVSLTRLLILSEPDFESARSKGRLPKGKLGKDGDKVDRTVLEILDEVLKQREGMYTGGSVEDDERLLTLPGTLTEREKHAVIVRLGEKRILKEARQTLGMMLADVRGTSEAGHGNEKDMKGKEMGGNNSVEEKGTSRKRVANGAGGKNEWKKARK